MFSAQGRTHRGREPMCPTRIGRPSMIGLTTIFAFAIGLAGGCGEKEPEVKLTPVTGVILIDGKPVEQVAIRCRPATKSDDLLKNIGQAYTDKDGKFEISVMKSGDGLPPGKYMLLVEWGELNLISMQYGGPDKLNGKYNDPKKPQITFEVVADKPTDLGELKLTTH